MIRSSLLTFFLLVTLSCSPDNDGIQKEDFVGTWTVTDVLYDNTSMPNWKGARLTIEQDRVDGGRYSMIDTRNDSIWSARGTWTKSTHKGEIILDDTLYANFGAEHNRMSIKKRLPWTATSTCENGICILIVTGYWEFIFERE